MSTKTSPFETLVASLGGQGKPWMQPQAGSTSERKDFKISKLELVALERAEMQFLRLLEERDAGLWFDHLPDRKALNDLASECDAQPGVQLTVNLAGATRVALFGAMANETGMSATVLDLEDVPLASELIARAARSIFGGAKRGALPDWDRQFLIYMSAEQWFTLHARPWAPPERAYARPAGSKDTRFSLALQQFSGREGSPLPAGLQKLGEDLIERIVKEVWEPRRGI